MESPCASSSLKRGFLDTLQEREVGKFSNSSRWKRRMGEDCVKKFKLQTQVEAQEYIEETSASPSCIMQILTSSMFVFTLTNNGACSIFKKTSGKFLRHLNNPKEETISTLFFNKLNNTLLTVSLESKDNFSSLVCKEYRLDPSLLLAETRPKRMFEDESIRYPGFIEFDEVNKKVLTFSPIECMYKVWQMTNYELAFSIPSDQIGEVKLCTDAMLLLKRRGTSDATLCAKIFNVESGEGIVSLEFSVDPTKILEFVELHMNKLFVKFEGTNLKIVDISTMESSEIPNTATATAEAFMFLFEIQRFLTFSSNNVCSYNFKGEIVNKFKLPTILSSWTSVSVSSNQHFIFLHTNSILPKDSPKKETPKPKEQGAIFVYGTLKGNLLCEITVPSDAEVAKSRPFTPPESMDSLFNEDLPVTEVPPTLEEIEQKKLARGLTNLSTLFYDEDAFELYAATTSGVLSVWCA